jgi:glutamyl-tRNA reductase
MKNIILLGSGNVATHLGIALKNSNYTIVQVFSKSIKNAKLLAKKLDTHFTNDLTKLKPADLIIVSIND